MMLLLRVILLCLCATVRCRELGLEQTDAHPRRSLLSSGNHKYTNDEAIELWANRIGPYGNPSETYEFYTLPFCTDSDPKKKVLTHVGEVIDSNRDTSTPFNIRFEVDVPTATLCTKELSYDEVALFRKAVRYDWYFQMYFDGLPIYSFIGKIDKILKPGAAEYRYQLFTHKHFDIEYNEDRVIGVAVSTNADHVSDVSEDVLPKGTEQTLPVVFTYSVKWHPSSIPYDRRLDRYAMIPRNPVVLEIHWFSILHSCVTVLLLTGVLATILMRVLKNDVSRYTRVDDEREEEEAGWKFIHGDVFRFPPEKSLLCAFVGCGTQLLFLTLFIFILALVGVFYPYNRGLMYTAQVVLYALTAGIAGYTSSTYYRQMEGERWVINILLTCTVFSGPFFLMFSVLNTVAIAYRSMAALPFGTIVVIFIVWALITVPLTVFMGITGKNGKTEFHTPCRTTKYPREIPVLPWYRTTGPQILLAGFLPFSAIFVELHYIFASVWGHKVYIVWSILLIIFCIVVVVTAFVTIALVYFQLAVEDHRWWWRSFLCGGSTGIFIYGYCFYYYVYHSQMSGFMQTSFFFGYMAVACYGVFIMLGTIGWRASLIFVRRIYKAIKCD